MSPSIRLTRLEFSGSLGDLGTLIPLAVGMIVINGLSPSGLFFSVGLYYILSGLYFGVTVPVQPMKVIGAYAIAAGLSPAEITASGAIMALLLFLIGATEAAERIGRFTPRSVVRGVQLSTGTLLMAQGVRFMAGTSRLQALHGSVEPYLTVQSLGPLPLGLVIGVGGGFLTLLFLENRRFPAGLLVVLGGILLGLLMGTHTGLNSLEIGLHLPRILPFGWPSKADFTVALLALALPQVPMTLGNAVIAYTDLSHQYFGEDSRRVTYRSSCLSMSLANAVSFLLGGMPLCHGAGGLAAHYRFGARTSGSNLFIGGLFILSALLMGGGVLAVVYLIPMGVLGVLLLFAGSQLAMTILDVRERADLFLVLTMLGVTLASNLAAGFLAGLALAWLLRIPGIKV